MASLNLSQAARAAGKTRPTVKKWIAAGKLAATRDVNGEWMIDTAELERVGWKVKTAGEAPVAAGQRIAEENKELRQQIEALRGQLADKEALAKSYQVASEQHQQQLQRVWEEYYDLKNQMKLLAAPRAEDPSVIITPPPPELHVVEGTKAEAEKKRGWWPFRRAA